MEQTTTVQQTAPVEHATAVEQTAPIEHEEHPAPLTQDAALGEETTPLGQLASTHHHHHSEPEKTTVV